LFVGILAAPGAAQEQKTSGPTDGIGETSAAPPDAPYVPAIPAATPEEALGRLRAKAAAGRDDQALGEALDFLKRYPDRPERGEVALAAGALRLRRGEAERAVEALTPLAADAGAPTRSRAIHLLGAALNALGRDRDILKSVPAADPAATSDRWLALAQVWRAAALERLGRKEESAELYRAIVASGQKSPVRAYALAAVAADWDRRGRPERARDALKRAQAEAAGDGLADLSDALTLASAHALTRARKLEGAQKAYADFAERSPDSPLLAQALFERGLVLKRLGRKEEAASDFESLLKSRPNSAYAGDAHLQLGQIDAELGRSDEAVAHYQAMGRASEGRDAGREALLLSAQVHYNAKRWADAVPLYRRYLADAPKDAKTKEVQGLLLVCLWQTNREDPQVAQLAAALPEHPLVAQIRWDLAAKAYKSRDWASAESLFRRELEAEPRGPRAADARFYRAEALNQLGRTDDAIDAYRRFTRLSARDQRVSSAWMRLGVLLDGAGRHVEGAEAFSHVAGADAADAAYDRAAALAKAGRASASAWESFAARFPAHEKAASALLSAAKLREEAKNDDGAVADYEKAAAGRNERARALYAVGRIHEKHKKRAAAKAAYLRLKDASPPGDPARLAGLLRLALLLELEDKAAEAAPLYRDVAANAEAGSKLSDTARRRLDALGQNGPQSDPSIIR
jgi:tetratricopeptide (TPR) repeat protein